MGITKMLNPPSLVVQIDFRDFKASLQLHLLTAWCLCPCGRPKQGHFPTALTPRQWQQRAGGTHILTTLQDH